MRLLNALMAITLTATAVAVTACGDRNPEVSDKLGNIRESLSDIDACNIQQGDWSYSAGTCIGKTNYYERSVCDLANTSTEMGGEGRRMNRFYVDPTTKLCTEVKP